jgi:hypothetical protein
VRCQAKPLTGIDSRLCREFSRREEPSMDRQRTGISNRKTPAEEACERDEHLPRDAGSPPPQDASGRVGEEPMTEVPNRQTSHKAGARSIAQKEDDRRYTDRGMPATHKKAGAFGKEPPEVAAESQPPKARS